jgi:hypothetical protein
MANDQLPMGNGQLLIIILTMINRQFSILAFVPLLSPEFD